jgi:hypothetical protein
MIPFIIGSYIFSVSLLSFSFIYNKRKKDYSQAGIDLKLIVALTVLIFTIFIIQVILQLFQRIF